MPHLAFKPFSKMQSLQSDEVHLARWQVAVAPLRQQPPDWTAFAAETASLLLLPQPCAGTAQLPNQLQSALMDAGRRLAVAAGAHLGSPAQQCIALPDPAAARTAMQGEPNMPCVRTAVTATSKGVSLLISPPKRRDSTSLRHHQNS